MKGVTYFLNPFALVTKLDAENDVNQEWRWLWFGKDKEKSYPINLFTHVWLYRNVNAELLIYSKEKLYSRQCGT